MAKSRFSPGMALFVTMVCAQSATAALPKAKLEMDLKKSWSESLPEGERALYVRILEAYREGRLGELVKFKDLMLKRYPKSVYIDNTLYLTGLLFFHRDQTAEALRLFGEITSNYSRGNKVPAALYAKSAVYTKLNLPKLSEQVLKEILVRYPGSPESQRAQMDLKLLTKNTVGAK